MSDSDGRESSIVAEDPRPQCTDSAASREQQDSKPRPLPAIRRPMVGLGLCVIAGMYLGFLFGGSFVPLMLAGLLSSILGLVFCWRRRPSPATVNLLAPQPAPRLVAKIASRASKTLPSLSLYGSVLFTAWAAAALFLTGYSSLPTNSQRTRAQITGIVAAEPSSEASPDQMRVKWKFPMRVEAIRLKADAGWKRADAEVQVRWFASARGLSPRYGDKWIIAGAFMDPPSLSASRFAGLRHYFYGTPNGSTLLSGGHGSRFMQICYAARRDASACLARGIANHPDTVGFLRTLLLGYNYELPEDVRQDFAWTGTIHIFAISGLHVAMIASMLVFVLSACGICRVYWIFFLAPPLVAYTMTTGMSPSAVRACIMGIIFFFAPLIRRRSDSRSALALAAVVILAVRPDSLFDIGFILSFSGVLALIVLYAPLERLGRRLYAPDPYRLQPEAWWQRAARGLGRHTWSLLAASAAASLVTAPIVAYYFNTVPVMGIIGNLLAVPLAFLIVFTGCLALLFGSCFGILAEVFNHANLALIALLTRCMQWIAGLPGSHFDVPSPSPWFCLAWYAALAALALRLTAKAPSEAMDQARDG